MMATWRPFTCIQIYFQAGKLTAKKTATGNENLQLKVESKEYSSSKRLLKYSRQP